MVKTSGVPRSALTHDRLKKAIKSSKKPLGYTYEEWLLDRSLGTVTVQTASRYLPQLGQGKGISVHPPEVPGNRIVLDRHLAVNKVVKGYINNPHTLPAHLKAPGARVYDCS